MPKFSWENQEPVNDSNSKIKKFNWDEQQEVGPSEIESGIASTVSGLTAGFDSYLAGGVNAAGRLAGIKNLGATRNLSEIEMTDEPLTADAIVESYRDGYKRSRENKAKDLETNPKATIAGNIAGAVVSPLSKIGAAKSLDGLSKLQKLGQAVKYGAAQGAIFGAGGSAADLTKGEFGKFGEDTLISTGLGAAVPVGIEGVKIGLQKIGSGSSNLGKKFFAARTGTSVENNSKYWNNADEINAAPEFSMIKDGVDDAVAAIKKEVDAGKMSVERAKEAMSELKIGVRNNLTDAKMDAREAVRKTEELFKESSARAIQPLKDKRAPTELAGQVVKEVETLRANMLKKSDKALDTLDTAFPGTVNIDDLFLKGEQVIKDLKDEGTLEALSMAKQVSGYLENIRGKATKELGDDLAAKASKQSDIGFGDLPKVAKDQGKSLLTFLRSKGGLNRMGQSNDILDLEANNLFRKNGMEADRAIELAKESGYLRPDDGINELLEKVRKELAGKKQFSLGSNEESLIGDYIKGMANAPKPAKVNLPRELDARSVKKLIQGLDKVSKYGQTATEFDKGLSAKYKELRNALDTKLKLTVDDYKKAMVPVAEDASLLSELKGFGDERGAIGKLGQIASAKGSLDRDLIAKLEKATGKGGVFTIKIDDYARAQSILKDPKKLDEIRRSLPEYQDYRQAMAKLAKMKPNWSRDQLERALSNSKEAKAMFQAEEALKKAESKFAPISKLGRESTQAKLESFGKPSGEKIEVRRSLQELEKLSGKKFIKDLENRGVLDSYSKSAMNGSRNTVFGTVLGAAMGSVFAGGGGMVGGASAGAIYGQMVDRYGPKMAKTVMDGLLSIKNKPSVKAIRSLSLPESVKAELEKDFKLFLIVNNTKKGESAWIQRGAENLNLDNEQVNRSISSKEGKKLLIEASDLPPNSKKLQLIKNKILQGEVK